MIGQGCACAQLTGSRFGGGPGLIASTVVAPHQHNCTWAARSGRAAAHTYTSPCVLTHTTAITQKRRADSVARHRPCAAMRLCWPKGRGGRVREGEGGVYEGGGGWLGTTSSPGSPMVPAEGGPNILKLKSSWHRRRPSKILAVSLQHWKGERGGGPGGGVPPPLLLRCTAVLIHHGGGGGTTPPATVDSPHGNVDGDFVSWRSWNGRVPAQHRPQGPAPNKRICRYLNGLGLLDSEVLFWSWPLARRTQKALTPDHRPWAIPVVGGGGVELRGGHCLQTPEGGGRVGRWPATGHPPTSEKLSSGEKWNLLKRPEIGGRF